LNGGKKTSNQRNNYGAKERTAYRREKVSLKENGAEGGTKERKME